MSFGEKLQELRRRAGMSQDTLAERLDVSRQAVSKWERDETMPETEKLIRIAQLFGASLDELLLDREAPEPEPEPEPQPRPQPVYRPDYRSQVRRHGYKLGYVLMAIGAVICAFSLIMRLVWPAIGSSFVGSSQDLLSDFTSNTMTGFGPFGEAEIVIEGGGELTADEKQAILDAIGGSQSGVDGLWNSAISQMEGMMNSATSQMKGLINSTANLFLLGLIPGGALLAAGAVTVAKGKKAAQQEPSPWG